MGGSKSESGRFEIRSDIKKKRLGCSDLVDLRWKKGRGRSKRWIRGKQVVVIVDLRLMGMVESENE